MMMRHQLWHQSPPQLKPHMEAPQVMEVMEVHLMDLHNRPLHQLMEVTLHLMEPHKRLHQEIHQLMEHLHLHMEPQELKSRLLEDLKDLTLEQRQLPLTLEDGVRNHL